MAAELLTDGVLDLSLGMNAGDLPQLLSRQEAAYILNGQIGSGLIKNRPATNKIAITAVTQGTITAATTGWFYGACGYTDDNGTSSLVASIGGGLFRFTPQYDTDGKPINAVLVDNQSNGLAQDTGDSTLQHWLKAAERWVVWNDGVNLPVFWDGSATNSTGSSAPTSRRSAGQSATPPELPAGKMLTYGLGQVWMALPDGFSFMMGDPVDWSTGTLAFGFRDAVLKSSINAALFGGGNFRVPSSTGQITGLTFTALLDSTLGTGPLQVFTSGAVYGSTAPYTPISASNPVTPLLTASLEGAGGASYQNASVNGDIFFRCSDASIRSLVMARRDFNQWGNTPVSFEVGPYINDDSSEASNGQNLLSWCSSVQFDNNELTLVNPVEGPMGVYCQNIVSLSLAQISGIDKDASPAYNGLWNIGNVLWLGTWIFNGVTRCFAFIFNSGQNTIELHEILPQSSSQTLDYNNTPITWQLVSRALMWNQTAGIQEFIHGTASRGKSEFDLCKLESAEMSIQEVDKQKIGFVVEYRPVSDANWYPWYSFTVDNTQGNKGYVPRIGLGTPPKVTSVADPNRLPYVDYAFQIRVTVTGSCRITALRIFASKQPQSEFAPPYK